MKTCLAIVLTLTLIGCAGTRPQIDAARLSEVRHGESRVADVIARFGRPDILLKNPDGTQTAAYMTGEGSRLSMIAALAGSASANVDSVIFYFDKGGTLDNYRTTHRAEAPSVATDAAGTVPVQVPAPEQTAVGEAVSTSFPAKPAVVAKPPARAAYSTQQGTESRFLPGNSWTTHVFEAPEPKASR